LGRGGSELIRYGSSSQIEDLLTGEREKNAPFSMHLSVIEPLDNPIEQFLSMLCFENRGKIDDLGVEIDQNSLKSGY